MASKENLAVLEEIRDLLRRQNIRQKDILSFKETLLYLDVSASYLYKLTNESKISYFKPGGKLNYFLKSDLDKWLLQNKVEGISDTESSLNDYLKRNENGRK